VTLTDLASIGTFVSGIAVVISLIYLAVQVRHAQKTQRALMHQARTERLVNAAMASMHTDIADVVTKMVHGGELTPREVLQTYYYMRVQVCVVEDALWQYDAGFLDKDSRDTAILNLQRVLLFPAARAAWLMQRPQLPPAVRERLDKLVAAPLADQTWDFAADYKKAHAQATTPQTPTQAA
jgi:hypothetical protein